MPCSTVMSGNATSLGPEDEHVAEIEVIGRDVDRDHRLRAAAAAIDA